MDNRANKTGALEPARYQNDMFISQLDRNGTILKQYKMKGVFPTDISAVPLDFGTNDQISSFSVTFQYQTFDVISNASSAVVQAIFGPTA